MKIFNKPVSSLLLCFLILLPESTFAIDLFGEKDEGIIFQAGKNVYLKYADQEKSSFGKNDHPVELDNEEISKSLELLEIVGEDYSNSEPVFTHQQINLLSKNLMKGLANAKPDQDIIFALSKSTSRLFGLKSGQYFVAGRAFYKDGKLNIIIGDYNRPRNEGYENAYDPTHVGIVAYNFNHGKRSKNFGKFDQIIAEVKGIENKQINGNLREDWFVIDLQLAAETNETKATSSKKEEMAKKRKELLEILGSEGYGAGGAAAYESKERRRIKEEEARRRKEQQEGGADNLEKRLTTLKQLKDKGLISDEEYALKRNRILEDI